MGAATEWARLVDEAIAGLRIEEGTSAVGICRQLSAARCAQGSSGEDSFTLG